MLTLIELILENITKQKIFKTYFIILYGEIPIAFINSSIDQFPNLKIIKNNICPIRHNNIRILKFE